MVAGLAVFFDIGDTLASPRVTAGHLPLWSSIRSSRKSSLGCEWPEAKSPRLRWA